MKVELVAHQPPYLTALPSRTTRSLLSLSEFCEALLRAITLNQALLDEFSDLQGNIVMMTPTLFPFSRQGHCKSKTSRDGQ